MAEEKKKVNKGLIAGIIAAVVVAIAAVVTVVVINLNKVNIVGSYNMTAILDADGNESADSLEMMKMFGMSYAIEFKEDKTGVFKIIMDSDKMGSLVSSFANALTDDEDTTSTEDISSSIPSETNVDFTYDDKKIKLSASTYGVATEMDYEVKDGAIIIDYNSQKMKFTK